MSANPECGFAVTTPRVGRIVARLCLCAALFSGWCASEDTVAEVMDAVVTRLYATQSEEDLYALDDAKVQKFLRPAELQVLATKHWYFNADVPVVVSVLRNVEQKVAPFWLEQAGFARTDFVVNNMEGWSYEVWQKSFPPGLIGLGVNGFDNFRPHYLVCVGPQQPGAKVTLSGFHPAKQTVEEMKPGAMTYYDWSELVLTDVPEVLRGQQLLPTSRGRGREASLVGAFRKTPFPSSDMPGPVFLTWSEDPSTTQNIQWRTSAAVTEGVVRFRKKGSDTAYQEVSAQPKKMEDRMLANDRYCHWFTAVLRRLEPDTTYEYQVGLKSGQQWNEPAEFRTAPAIPKPFSFLYCSDTHSRKEWADLLKSVFELHPEAAFCTVSGDLVGTGLERENWDLFLTYGEPMFRQRPIMPAIGNHDAQYGLGAGMYLDIFGLPENGPKDLAPECAYTFAYSNTQFFILDVMSDAQPQQAWLLDKLEKCTATWKIAVFHFPIYSVEEAYPELEAMWGSLFDQYHVDLALTGHVHTHLRTYPLHAGKRVESAAEGTVYVTSVSIPSRPVRLRKPDYAEVWLGGGSFCNVIAVEDRVLTFRATTADGTVKDEFVLRK
ncbi:MAG: metallophosphoesterase family protein [Candidatus Hydrogenedentes bacterium]|nr:metallophosphoesterase family protein [Candidatus Hydrogenedentota bacterium]